MVDHLARNWGAVLLRGILAIVFGLVALFVPGAALTALVWVFGAYALIDGILAVIAGVRRATEQRGRWLWLIIEGLLGIAAGIVAFLWTGLAGLALLFLIASWAVVTGIFEIMQAIRLRQEIHGEFWLALGGLASIVFGILLFVWPAAGALAVIWLIGAYGIIFGIALIALAFRLRSWHNRTYQNPAGA